ncbi:MAG: MBL fold metallo-hydrolase [Gemmatimonadetes bacterium]|nr:MAG: MBL fold metallo-hydrolase [Gemmatimonadota bacterium]
MRLIASAVIAALACAPASRGVAYDPARTQVVLLGTGTPNPDPARSGPAVAVVVHGAAYLVDAGAGVVRRAAAAEARGVKALAQPNLRIVFLTHLHTDHTVGLPDLIFSPWVMNRAAPLAVYGPPGTTAMVDHLERAYSADVTNRSTGLQPHTPDGWRAVAREVTPGVVFRDSNVTVTAFLVPHDGWAQAFGYRFETRDRAIVISGDTRASDSVVAACRGCDVLVHEVYSEAGLGTRPPDWQRYHRDAHTSGPALGTIAAQARPKLLILYHGILWGQTPEEVVEEVRRHFPGRVVFANDLEVY